MKLIDEHEMESESNLEGEKFSFISRTYKSSKSINKDNVIDFSLYLINKVGANYGGLSLKNSETNEEYPFVDETDIEMIKKRSKKIEYDLLCIYGEKEESEDGIITLLLNLKDQTIQVITFPNSAINTNIFETEIE